MKSFLKIGLIVAVLVAAYPGYLAYEVWDQSHQDELHSADAIVVLGAAQYNGEPSPVLKARLDQAKYLYDEGFSGIVIVTGGKQSGDEFTEAEASRLYLEEQGVASEDILEEEEGRTTLESLRRVWVIAEENGFESALFVSDPLHSERIKRIAANLGWEQTYTSPASYVRLNRSRETKAKEIAREVGAILLFEFLER